MSAAGCNVPTALTSHADLCQTAGFRAGTLPDAMRFPRYPSIPGSVQPARRPLPPCATMTKSELIERLAQQADLPKKRAEEAVNCIFQTLSQALADGQRIEIRGFGSFSLKQHRSYTGRNPKTGDVVPVSEKASIHFKVGKELRERVDQLTPMPE